MMVDTGASTDILDEETFAKIAKSSKIQLQEASARIFTYGSTSQLKVLGKFKADMEARGNTVTATVHVLEGAHGSLLGYTTASELGLVNMNINTIALHERLIEQYPSIVDVIGQLKDYEVKLCTLIPPYHRLRNLHGESHSTCESKSQQSSRSWKSKGLSKRWMDPHLGFHL